MNKQEEQSRIVIVAGPSRGRSLTKLLGASGYEVHRTPNGANISALLNRLRPHLAIATLDPTWFDGLAVARQVMGSPRPVPVLIVGDPHDDARAEHLLWVPSEAPEESLLEAVEILLHPVG